MRKGTNTMQSLKKKTEGFTSLSHKDKGFTIIEVMIVLVIAAVIILIVFLAVPALQRNSRNNQRKNDASRISAAVTEYTNNNNGTPPGTWGLIKPFIGTPAFYTLPDDGTSISAATANQTVTNASSAPVVAHSGTCQTSGANAGKAAAGGSSRQFVVLYKVEAGGDDVAQCIAS